MRAMRTGSMIFTRLIQEPVHKIKRYICDRPPFSPRTAGISGVIDESRSHPILFFGAEENEV
jgi:hypothetical protein